MGFFSRGASYIQEGAIENILESVEAIEPKYENFDEAALATIVEAEENYNNIMQAVGIDEFAYFEENGVEMVYTEATAGGFISKVKQFFVNLYQKIKGLFNKFIALIDSYAKSDKDFVNKYRRHLLSANTKDFEYKGFKFTHLDANVEGAMKAGIGTISGIPDSVPSNTPGNAEAILKSVEDRSDCVEKMRGAAAKAIGGTGGNLEAGEFSKEIFMAFRDGEDSKVSIDGVNVSEQLSIILNYGDTKKKAEKSFKALEKSINTILKDLDKAEKAIVKEVPNKTDSDANNANALAVRFTSTCIFYVKEMLSIGQTINGALLTALKDQNRQAKSICVSLMNYKPKNESFSYGNDDYSGSALGSVTIK